MLLTFDGRVSDGGAQMVWTAAASTVPEEMTEAQTSQPADSREAESIFAEIFGAEKVGVESDGFLMTAAKILTRLALATLLAAMLAFRPRKRMRLPLPRNPFLKETQILLALVGAALMMIVADNAARAFGIFAAASLVRFRTNIRDPKEITVLLLSLGID
jgi:hypothetical protein